MHREAVVLGRDLAELNDGFLQLVAAGTAAGLSELVLTRLQALDPAARGRLAEMPFALFGFGFEDEAGWAQLLSPGVRDLAIDGLAPAPPAERFTLLALTALRGLVRIAPRSVLNWIGLPRETGQRLAAVEIGSLAPVAALAAHRLRGRLAPREMLWLRFIAAAEDRDARQLALLAAWGRQWTIRRSLGLGEQLIAPRGRRRSG